MITLCLAGSGKQLQRTLYALLLPNGNWNDHTQVDLWLPPGTVFDRIALGRMVGTAIANVFVPTIMAVYQRNKMKGVAAAIGTHAGLQACHGMLQHAMELFAIRHKLSRWSKPSTVGRGSLGRAPPSLPAPPALLALADTPGGGFASASGQLGSTGVAAGVDAIGGAGEAPKR